MGLATAYRLAERFPGAAVTVLEKENGVGQHQTGHNSGVLHCGLYYKPGSVKARLAVSGIRQMVAFCQENAVPHEVCGKLVVAADESEVPRLQGPGRARHRQRPGGPALADARRDARNRAARGRRGGAARAAGRHRRLSPRCAPRWWRAWRARGARVVTGARVRRLRAGAGRWMAETPAGAFTPISSSIAPACTATGSPNWPGERREVRILPFRGEYYKIRPERQHLVRNLIYPVARSAVSISRRALHAADPRRHRSRAERRAGVRARRLPQVTISTRATLCDALSYGGFWRFLRRYPSMCWYELRRSFSRELFCRSLQRLVPEIQPDGPGHRRLRRARAGHRARPASWCRTSSFIARPNALHVLNAPSPAATASLAIGAEIAGMVPEAVNSRTCSGHTGHANPQGGLARRPPRLRGSLRSGARASTSARRNSTV